VGVLQAVESFNNGFWSARSWSFYQQPLINTLLWLRMIPDTVFILFGAVPLVGAAVYGLLHLRKTGGDIDSAPVGSGSFTSRDELELVGSGPMRREILNTENAPGQALGHAQDSAVWRTGGPGTAGAL
jgi:hypothetical protein